MIETIVHIDTSGITNKADVKKFFAEHKPGRYLVTSKSIRRRSNNQNAYLHGVVIPLVFQGLRDIGFDEVRDHEDAKMIIKDLFLRRTIRNEKTNTEITVIRHTSELTTVDMMEFIAEVQKWAATYLNLYIPDPGQEMPMFNNQKTCVHE